MLLNPKRLTFIVDDDEDYSEMLKSAFTEMHPGCRLEFFLSGQKLIARLGEIKMILPDLILLDMRMPEMDGLETLREIKQNQRTQKIPTVMFSVSDSSSDIDLCYLAGVNAYVVKPLKSEDLNSIVNTTCRYWLEASQLPTKLWIY